MQIDYFLGFFKISASETIKEINRIRPFFKLENTDVFLNLN